MIRARRLPSMLAAGGLAVLALACATASGGGTPPPTVAGDGNGPLAGAGADTLDPSLVPAGYGTLRQEDVALRLQYLGLLARLLPLDESVIRVLAPDAYRSLRELLASRSEEIAAVSRRYALARPSVWYVSFHGIEQGETRFSPLELTVSSGGREYRPVDAIPLTTGFGEQRLGQRETQAALYVFDGALNVNQPLTVTFQTAQSSAWEAILRRVERERALVRSRVSRAPSS